MLATSACHPSISLRRTDPQHIAYMQREDIYDSVPDSIMWNRQKLETMEGGSSGYMVWSPTTPGTKELQPHRTTQIYLENLMVRKEATRVYTVWFHLCKFRIWRNWSVITSREVAWGGAGESVLRRGTQVDSGTGGPSPDLGGGYVSILSWFVKLCSLHTVFFRVILP